MLLMGLCDELLAMLFSPVRSVFKVCRRLVKGYIAAVLLALSVFLHKKTCDPNSLNICWQCMLPRQPLLFSDC